VWDATWVNCSSKSRSLSLVVSSGALWWIYFARSVNDASETIALSEDPGRLARSAYTYFHLPIIAAAAADELTVAHPDDPGTLASISLTLGGAALFVAGHGVFLWAVSGRVPWSRLVAVIALAALAPVGFAASALTLAGTAALIVVLLAIGDSVTHRRRWRPSRETPT
jgi:low temperature requirement protein LtrA